MKRTFWFVIAFAIAINLGVIFVLQCVSWIGADLLDVIKLLILIILNATFFAALVIELILMCYGTGYQLSVMLVTFIAAGFFSSFCCRMMTLALFVPNVTLAPYDLLMKWCMQLLTFVAPLTIITAFPIIMLNYKNGWTDKWKL